jgi:hypothetical protein
MVACLSQFIMAMALHPDVQVKVQQELDSVIGRGRLPTFADRESLPYMECVFKECLRWGTPAPLCKAHVIVQFRLTHCFQAVPHRLVQTDIYEDYILPEGTIVSVSGYPCLPFLTAPGGSVLETYGKTIPLSQKPYLNFVFLRGILHDERLYKNAQAFLPSRFENLDKQEAKRLDPTNYVYGFGRRYVTPTAGRLSTITDAPRHPDVVLGIILPISQCGSQWSDC